ncbi:hypothetical protein LMG28614_00844 [Paraburkholderia ultramafica]|uniref:DUF4148 domain-containing protein n=1 Tax=Paraburkholderia ultramafica TaxID=1544867 RepID=A0A6S7AWK0_9BURK|nr:hypothetical protein [Paraburkholderia ultramafica]CAB3779453.1 hypothetical protein LMG28614_00844 [Paraburkholderia ultramafica]
MNTKLLATLLIAAASTLGAPAFASGYGPAPHYRPEIGAPASQRGQSAQTVASERANAGANAYGGVNAVATQSGAQQSENGQQSVSSGQ